jgi:transcriptional regulator with PAS, ATPase and Fis domain/tetratricopeptide (TPR) repeat protein
MDPLRRVSTLARSGHFKEALQELDLCKAVNSTAALVRRMELLERLGWHDKCRTLASRLLESKQLTNSQRATCHYVVGSLFLEQGDTEGATAHLQRSISFARQTEDLELLCNVQIKQLGLVADLSGPDAATPVLSELRMNAIRLGDPYVTAAVHTFVAQMDASRGLFRSAERHLRLADALIEKTPSPWLTAHSCNIKLAICVLESDIERGQIYADRGKQLADECGAAAVRRAIAANESLLYLLAGNFSDAIESINRALIILQSSGERRNGCLDTLARIRLAEGRMDDCGVALDLIEESIKSAADQSMYANRYALLTRGQLLARRGLLDEALHQIDSVHKLAAQIDDKFLLDNARLTKAELLESSGRANEAISALRSFSEQIQNFSPELFVQYERTLACTLLDSGNYRVAECHYKRAQRVSIFIKNAPAQADLERHWQNRICTSSTGVESTNPRTSIDKSVDTTDTVHSIAAILIHAGRGEFIGRELAEIVSSNYAECSVAVRRISATDGSSRTLYEIDRLQPNAAGASLEKTLVVQQTASHRVEVVAKLPLTIGSTALLNSLTTIISTLHDLERARADREERATIWPADEVVVEGDTSVITGHMRETMLLAQKVARTTVSVLITGESGTGKEIIARAIHACSARAQKPFVAFNCAAIPRDLVESQLFGHRRGAFTGADRDYLGVIRGARDGTLFLDEIGDLSLELQPKLLRFLESGEIAPLGDPATHRVNVRIVAATNANLDEAVRDGRFREDLFYRLNVVPLSLKPLRERRDEIPALVNTFVERAAKEFNKGRLEIAEETIERLLLYRWPGNVRQLHNEVRRIVALAEPNSTLEPELISRDIIEAMPIFRQDPASRRELAVRLNDKLTPTLLRVECEMIKAALRDNQGRVDAVAKALGISRKGLYLKRQRLGL